MDKSTALHTLNEMPQQFDLEELFERLIVIEKIEKGREDSRQGKTFTHEQVREKLSKWLK